MYSARAFVLFALTSFLPGAFGVPQLTPSITQSSGALGSAVADLNAPAAASSAPDACGGCYVVADVAALVWYSEAFINTAATQIVGVQVGNGTRSTRTSYVQNEAPFTYDPGRISSAGMQDLVLTAVDYAPTVVISGATLSSPTAYNIFSAYSLTSAYMSNGKCVTTSGSATTVSPAYSETLISASGRVSPDPSGQQAFINYINFSKCSNGGENVVASALIPVADVTVTVTTSFSTVSLAAITSRSLAPVSLTTTPTSTARPADVITLTEVMSSTTITAILSGTATPVTSVSIPKIVFGSRTITPTPKPVSLPVLPGTLSGSIVTGSISGNTTIIGSTQTVETVSTIVTRTGGGLVGTVETVSQITTGPGGGLVATVVTVSTSVTGMGSAVVATVETVIPVSTEAAGGNSTSVVAFAGEAADWKRDEWRVLVGMGVASVLGIVMVL